MCSKICIPVSTHNETQKKCINTAHKWQWNNCTNSVKSRNTNSKYRRRDPLKTLCHMGPLHPMLNIRQPPKQLSHCRAGKQSRSKTKREPKSKTSGTENRNTETPETRANGDKNQGNKKFWTERLKYRGLHIKNLLGLPWLLESQERKLEMPSEKDVTA